MLLPPSAHSHRLSCVCSSNTAGRSRCSSSRSPSPDPSSAFAPSPTRHPSPFLIRFDDSSAGCVPCKCSIVGAGRGQEFLFNCSKAMEFEGSIPHQPAASDVHMLQAFKQLSAAVHRILFVGMTHPMLAWCCPHPCLGFCTKLNFSYQMEQQWIPDN